ncbi:RsmD family RNA methyltransferase [Alkalihalophilus lindianensis]|uniref:RsmD family RNA methyltransferase n=1 Tax=Alkalihalophilus lindianensis TaxID=1630542 RepID=A0ABU3X743_9BACI|nr:methyltransferase domain-containing protein [Alkalihalophilus lindianensis]MDV2683697.1 RsmD family RNA methyltransferase [Alkalihalophilus lindianensis]
MRSLFGIDTSLSIVESSKRIDPSRSPFIKARIDVSHKGASLSDMKQQMKGLEIQDCTFKIIYVKNEDLEVNETARFEERRKIEREIGLLVQGQVDLHHPEIIFGIMKVREGWVFGRYTKSESVWLKHQKKPQNYSTALSTRVARAVVNIAAPHTEGMKMIDPCCGAGTVLIEALSMGMDIIGSDLNPLVTTSARENIAHFGFECEVALLDLRDVTGRYDVVIIDMPYNLCSVLTQEEQLEMLQSARKLAKKMVVITIENIDSLIEQADFTIVDRCVAKKSTFSRQVLVCQ